MTAQSKPEIKAAAKEDFTKISWVPDLAKFGMSAMDEDIVALMERCAAALPACRPPPAAPARRPAASPHLSLRRPSPPRRTAAARNRRRPRRPTAPRLPLPLFA